MTWTWRDDDPATAASAQNLQTHVEMRLRSLELAGGGGLQPGDEVYREGDTAVAAAIQGGDEIVPADPTKATLVRARLFNISGSPQTVTINSWFNNQQDAAYMPDGVAQIVTLILSVGESYYFPDLAGCVVQSLMEKTL